MSVKEVASGCIILVVLYMALRKITFSTNDSTSKVRRGGSVTKFGSNTSARSGGGGGFTLGTGNLLAEDSSLDGDNDPDCGGGSGGGGGFTLGTDLRAEEPPRDGDNNPGCGGGSGGGGGVDFSTAASSVPPALLVVTVFAATLRAGRLRCIIF